MSRTSSTGLCVLCQVHRPHFSYRKNIMNLENVEFLKYRFPMTCYQWNAKTDNMISMSICLVCLILSFQVLSLNENENRNVTVAMGDILIISIEMVLPVTLSTFFWNSWTYQDNSVTVFQDHAQCRSWRWNRPLYVYYFWDIFCYMNINVKYHTFEKATKEIW